ncbi:MAG: GNAT family N-acetyltransferase [Thermoplasmata archaeon]
MVDYVSAHEVEKQKVEKYIDFLYDNLQRYITREEMAKDVYFCLENGRIIGAYDEDEMIGAAVGVYTPFFDKFHIAHLAVDIKHRRKGIGEDLMERIVPKDMDASVHLNIENPITESFYKSIGYELTHKRLKKEKKE